MRLERVRGETVKSAELVDAVRRTRAVIEEAMPLPQHVESSDTQLRAYAHTSALQVAAFPFVLAEFLEYEVE